MIYLVTNLPLSAVVKQCQSCWNPHFRWMMSRVGNTLMDRDDYPGFGGVSYLRVLWCHTWKVTSGDKPDRALMNWLFHLYNYFRVYIWWYIDLLIEVSMWYILRLLLLSWSFIHIFSSFNVNPHSRNHSLLLRKAALSSLCFVIFRDEIIPTNKPQQYFKNTS